MEVEHYVAALSGTYTWLDAESHAEAFRQAGPAWTALIDGEVAAMAGVAMKWPGVGTAWAVWTPLGRRYPLAIHRVVRDELRKICVEYRLQRVDADVLAHFTAARRWAGLLGFVKESDMPKGGPEGVDMIRMVLFP